jgi:nucleotide-binding universal stress UspA family protein
MGRIVVGVDGSQESHLAMQWALTQARCLGADVVAVHVFTYTLPDVPDSAVAHPATIDEVIANAERRAGTVIEGAIDAAEDLAEGVTVTPRLIRGREAPEHLLDEAEGADLLVLGSRGLGGFKKLLLGSVSQKCIDHAPCTVMIVRGPPPGTVTTPR